MAPTTSTSPADLVVRQYGYGYGSNSGYSSCNYGYIYTNGTCQYSGWSSYGRWIFAVGLVIIAVLLLACCGAFNARRRRARGAQPRYGTGWIPMGGPAPKYSPGPNPAYNEAPPPGYNQQQSGTTYAAAGGNGNNNNGQGYYGGGGAGAGANHGNNGGIELQQPGQAYARGGENVYAPPAGPPPGKK